MVDAAPSTGDVVPAGGDGPAVRARAKVNLRLRVFGREESGFHGLESLFLALELADGVRVEVGGEGTALRLELGEHVPPGSVPRGAENLCLRAVEAFREAVRRRGGAEPGGVTVHLEKRIPAGAGLGGGSADAAAVLRSLNARLDRPLDPVTLTRVAGRLGSDVPFALTGAAAALGWRRGDRLLPVEAPPARPALVALPGIGIPTPEAYRWLDRDRAAGAGPGGDGDESGAAVLPPAGALGRWELLTTLAGNDFQAPVFRRHPSLASLRELLAPGALVALLAGSGDAVFGIYPDEESRDRAAARVVEETGVPVRRTRTAASGPGGPRWPLV